MNIPHVLSDVVEGSYHVGESTNLPKLNDSKNIFPYLLSNSWLFVHLITTLKSPTIGQKPTKPTKPNNHLEMCFIQPGFLNLFSNFVQHNDYNLGIDFSNWADLKEFYQWTGLAWQFWPMVSFLSFRRSTESVLISDVSRQDPGSSLSPESVTDPGSSMSPESVTDPGSSLSPESVTNPGSSWSLESVTDPRSSSSPEELPDPGSSSSPESVTDPGSDSSSDSHHQLPLQYLSVGHSSSGLTFPLSSCHKSQTNNQHYLVKQHTPVLQLVYPGYFL